MLTHDVDGRMCMRVCVNGMEHSTSSRQLRACFGILLMLMVECVHACLRKWDGLLYEFTFALAS